MKKSILLLIMFLSLLPAAAQEQNELVLGEFLYPVSVGEMDIHYKDNMDIFIKLRNILSSLESDPDCRIVSIELDGYASPEGRIDYNRDLSVLRAEGLKDFICDHFPLGESLFHIQGHGIDWERLADLAAVSEVPFRDEVMDILLHTPVWIFDASGKIVDGRKRRLGMLHGGESWNWLLQHVYPLVRRTTVKVRFNKIPSLLPDLDLSRSSEAALPPVTTAPPVLTMPQRLELPAAADTVQTDTIRKTVLAFKTNLLTTALAWLNVGMEIPFARNRFSFVYDHQFPWWTFGQNENEYCLRHLQMSAELRWWFSPRKKPATRHQIVRDRLSGHFLACYGMVGQYDFQWERKICYQGEYWSAGLTYGYSTPVGKHVNLEFFLSVGYAVIPYRHFIPSADYSELYYDPEESGTLKYIGPTKIGISLVFPIRSRRIVECQKGGGR